LSDLLEAKDQLRQALIDRRGRLSLSTQMEAAEAVASKLLARKEVYQALEVGLYWPTRGEVPTRECFRRLCANAHHVYLPRIIPSKDGLEWVKLDYEGQLTKGPFGVLEPDPTLPAVDVHQLQVLVIPGVVFDIRGHRIGWGKGYYDRVMQGFSGKRVALAYDFQVLEQIPVGEHDEPVEVIVTESRVIECQRP
jgi:5-formyltetrahydrofolate cyclo-ligase